MKKIIKSFLAIGTLFAVTACNLDQKSPTMIDPEEAYSLEYCTGVRGFIYVDLKSLFSGGFYSSPDIYADVFNVMLGSGNQGRSVFNWYVYATTTEVNSFWSSYYSAVMHINYALKHLDESYPYLTDAEKKIVDGYKGEMYFFRALVMHRAALLFCEDYKAEVQGVEMNPEDQLGLPYPTTWDPEAKLPRKTLKDLYAQMEEDLKEAEKAVKTPGSATNPIYLTVDAITAFRAQLALYLHDYQTASNLAKSLYGTYALVDTKEAMENMWFQDNSTENILQLEVLPATLSSVNAFSDYINASWMESLGTFYCAPIYVPEQKYIALYDNADIRKGIYIAEYTVNIGSNRLDGYLLNKFRGNTNLQTNTTTLGYRNRPKVFRVADMYLIDAEAQWRLGGDALTPLNVLRQSRGLAPLQAADVAEGIKIGAIERDGTFKAIMEERMREFIGEGSRLYDLKRWGIGFKRDINSSLQGLVDVDAYFNEFENLDPTNPKFVWPIPQEELVQNPNFGDQNYGY